MSSTEGSGGGEPLRLSKEPVEKPEIQRGAWIVELKPGEEPVAGRPFTFQADLPGFRLTYHGASVGIVIDRYAHVYVAESDVVTWEKLGA